MLLPWLWGVPTISISLQLQNGWWKIVENKISRLSPENHLISRWHPYPQQKFPTNLWIFFHKPVGLLHQQSGFAAMDTSWVGFKSMFQSTSWVTFHLGMFIWLPSAFFSLEINLKCVRGHIDIWGAQHENHQKPYQNLYKYFAYNKVLKMVKFS